MKIYEKPTIDIETFETPDVLLTSGVTSGDPWDPDIETPIFWE